MSYPRIDLQSRHQKSEERMPKLQDLSKALDHFVANPSSFQIVHTRSTSPVAHPFVKRLYVLDSSFNPPTLAHFRICAHALFRHRSLCRTWRDKRSRDKGSVTDGYQVSAGGVKEDAASDGQQDAIEENPGPPRLLLLLSTKNADKAPAPASFAHRLALMQLLSQDIYNAWRESLDKSKDSSVSEVATYSSTQRGQSEQGNKENKEEAQDDELIIDVGLTTSPLFTDKLLALESSPVYQVSHISQQHESTITTQESPNKSAPNPESSNLPSELPSKHNQPSSSPQQTHLMGADTLARVLDPKYYPNHILSSLSPLLGGRHSVRVSRRPESSPKDNKDKDPDILVSRLRNSEMLPQGAKPEWADRIEVVNTEAPISSSSTVSTDISLPSKGEEAGGGEVSSTMIRRLRARTRTRTGDDNHPHNREKEEWENLCTPNIAGWIKRHDLYL